MCVRGRSIFPCECSKIGCGWGRISWRTVDFSEKTVDFLPKTVIFFKKTIDFLPKAADSLPCAIPTSANAVF